MNLKRNQPRQRAAHASTRLAAVTLLLIGFAALRGHPISAATQGGQGTLSNPSTAKALEAGASDTLFTVTLPIAAACTGDTAKAGYHVYSYLVPKGTSVTTVTFLSTPSNDLGIVDSTSTYWGAANTANDTGQVVGVPMNFSWGALVEGHGGFVPLSTLLGGGASATWEAGLACATSSQTRFPEGTTPLAPGTVTDWWGTDITFTASATDPAGFTWTTAALPPPTTTTRPAATTTTTTKPRVTTTTKPRATTTTQAQTGGATTTTIGAGAGGATTTTFNSTGTTFPVTTGTDPVYVDTSGSTGGSLPRTGSPVHREVGLGLFAIGTGMMLLGLDLRWKLRGAFAS